MGFRIVVEQRDPSHLQLVCKDGVTQQLPVIQIVNKLALSLLRGTWNELLGLFILLVRNEDHDDFCDHQGSQL